MYLRFAALILLLTGCMATETMRVVQTPKPLISNTTPIGKSVSVSIGKFNNKSSYQKGIFSDGVDRLGSQAQTTLIAHLNLSNRFNVLDRSNTESAKQEADINKQKQNIMGANYIIAGDVTEFGRKVVGDYQLFGILGRGKNQIAYAKVTINVINVLTSQVVLSVQGAGEYKISTREVVGFGGTASYDSTLNGKVLDLAIREGVDKLGAAVDNGQLK